MLFLNNLNLDGNELLNAVLHKSTSATRPATPVVGQLTYDTEDFTIYSWNGTAWVSVSDKDAILSVVGTSPINASEDPETRQVTITVDSATAEGLGVIQLAGDLTGGSATAPVVSGVGYGTSDATSAADIHSAVLASHTQNTDTGTTSTTFQIDSGNTGPKLKNFGGTLEIRNAADSGFANLRVEDLDVKGDLTYVHSTDVYLGDSIVTLNALVMDSTMNSNGGVEVKRLLTDEVGTGTVSGVGTAITGSGTAFTTDLSVGDTLVVGAERKVITAITSDTALTIEEAFTVDPSGSAYSFANQANAKIYFDNSAGVWKVVDGATTSLQTFPLVRKFSASIGDGTTKDFTITHNMNTQDVTVAIRLAGSDYAAVYTDWKAATVNTVTVHFSKAPSTNQYRVTITG